MIEAVKPDGLILDLEVIRPNPRIELDGRLVAEIDAEALFRWAEAATAAVDARIKAGDLVEEAVDDHDVRTHYTDGAEVVEDFAPSKRRIPTELVVAPGNPGVIRRRKPSRARTQGASILACTGATEDDALRCVCSRAKHVRISRRGH